MFHWAIERIGDFVSLVLIYFLMKQCFPTVCFLVGFPRDLVCRGAEYQVPSMSAMGSAGSGAVAGPWRAPTCLRVQNVGAAQCPCGEGHCLSLPHRLLRRAVLGLQVWGLMRLDCFPYVCSPQALNEFLFSMV